jgi:hypothetical protein
MRNGLVRKSRRQGPGLAGILAAFSRLQRLPDHLLDRRDGLIEGLIGANPNHWGFLEDELRAQGMTSANEVLRLLFSPSLIPDHRDF